MTMHLKLPPTCSFHLTDNLDNSFICMTVRGDILLVSLWRSRRGKVLPKSIKTHHIFHSIKVIIRIYIFFFVPKSTLSKWYLLLFPIFVGDLLHVLKTTLSSIINFFSLTNLNLQTYVRLNKLFFQTIVSANLWQLMILIILKLHLVMSNQIIYRSIKCFHLVNFFEWVQLRN